MSGGKVIEITSKNELENIIKNNKNQLVVLKFSAEWCGPCKKLAPEVAKYSEDEECANVIFCDINVDKCQDIAGEYGVQAMPTIQFIKNGSVDESCKVIGNNIDSIKKSVNKLQSE